MAIYQVMLVFHPNCGDSMEISLFLFSVSLAMGILKYSTSFGIHEISEKLRGILGYRLIENSSLNRNHVQDITVCMLKFTYHVAERKRREKLRHTCRVKQTIKLRHQR